jgi:type VI secretion system secreted protein Hcp
MAIDIFAVFTNPISAQIGIPESTSDPRSKGIRVLSFSMGVENKVNIGSSSGGAGAGKATFHELIFTKAIDTTSPALLYALTTGAHYDTVTFEFHNTAAGQTKGPGLVYSLACKMAVISKIEQSVSQGDEMLTETVILQYGAIQIKTRTQNKDGTFGKEIMAQWSKVKNNATFDV